MYLDPDLDFGFEGKDHHSKEVSASDTVLLDTIAGYKGHRASTEPAVLQAVEIDTLLALMVEVLFDCTHSDLDSRFGIVGLGG